MQIPLLLSIVLASLLIPAKLSLAKTYVETETGFFYTDPDCDYDSQSIGPITDHSFYKDYFGYLGVRFEVIVNCISHTNGHRFSLRGFDQLLFLEPVYNARMRTWYADGQPIVWYKFESDELELNPELAVGIWSEHMNQYLTFSIFIEKRPLSRNNPVNTIY